MGVGGEYWFGGWLRKAGFSGGLGFLKVLCVLLLIFSELSLLYPAFGDHPDRGGLVATDVFVGKS